MLSSIGVDEDFNFLTGCPFLVLADHNNLTCSLHPCFDLFVWFMAYLGTS
jgi:hypothetical protein